MKKMLFFIMILTNFAFADEFIRTDTLYYVHETNDKYTPLGSVEICFEYDKERNYFPRCYSFNHLEDHKLFVDLESGNVILQDLDDGSQVIVGTVDKNGKSIYADRSYHLKPLSIKNKEGLYFGFSTDTDIVFDPGLGCWGVFDCYVNFLSSISKMHLHIKKEGWSWFNIERVKVY